MGNPPDPDPSTGVFETMLVAGGEPLELAPHLDRLRSSVERLYGAQLPADAAPMAMAEASAFELGRVRLTASPRPGKIALGARAVAIDAAIAFPPWERGLELRTQAVDGWRGEHKWADRRLLDGLDGAAAPAAALLVDVDGAVLETTRANLFVVRADGTLATPPLDGRILPGVARSRAIELAREAGIEPLETELAVADLATAREVFTTGSVRGVEPVRSIDGAPVGHPRPSVTETIAAGLRRRWLGGRQAAPPTAV